MPCASKPKINPPRTSPAPAVAKVGGAFELMMARPSGAAITVSAPFSTITAPLVRAAARARVSLSPPDVEQTRELALVRREHASASDRFESSAGRAANTLRHRHRAPRDGRSRASRALARESCR